MFLYINKMPKVGGEINKNFYKYSSKEYDENNEIIEIKFFITQLDLINDFPMSRITLQRYFKNKKRIKKYNNIDFEKIKEPVFKRVLNDVNYYKKIENNIT